MLFNAVGGGTVIYAAHWQRNMPSDFRVRTLDGVADDWPLTYEDLAPYYERVRGGLRRVRDCAATRRFRPEGPPLPPAPLGPMGRAGGARRTISSAGIGGPRPTPSRRARMARSSPATMRPCMWGCVEGAKGRVDITHWPAARRSAGARARHQARAFAGSKPNAAGLAHRRGIHRPPRSMHFQKAAVIMLAANGIGTPRLLLHSASARFPNGLANSSGLSGRRLMLHPFGTVVGLFDSDLGSTHGLWGQHIHCLEFYETDTSRGFVRGAKWGLQPTGGPLSMTRGYPWGEANAIWGIDFHRQLRKRLGHSAMWGIIAEDLPEEQNRVVLDPVLKDANGIPAPQADLSHVGEFKAAARVPSARAKESFEAAGANEVVIAPLIRETGWHILGTCKMGLTRPRRSWTPGGGRHDVANLFIYDGSIWPTSSGMNPTATIAALALRCAEHLVEQRRTQKVSV